MTEKMTTIRPAAPPDIDALAHIHDQGWRAAYGGAVDPGYLDSVTLDMRRADWARWLTEKDMQTAVALDASGTPCGFVSYGRLRTPPPGSSPIRPLYSGEIYGLYVLPAAWRQGTGTRLMEAAAEGLAAQRHKSLCLWVLEKNANAAAFYKARGGQRCGNKDIMVGPSAVRDVCFGWRDSAILRGIS